MVTLQMYRLSPYPLVLVQEEVEVQLSGPTSQPMYQISLLLSFLFR